MILSKEDIENDLSSIELEARLAEDMTSRINRQILNVMRRRQLKSMSAQDIFNQFNKYKNGNTKGLRGGMSINAVESDPTGLFRIVKKG